MKNAVASLLLLAFVVGDFVHFINPNILTAGIFRVIKVHDGLYDIHDDKYPATIIDVPEKQLEKVPEKILRKYK